jgi:predicted  nucleic acid-binding Zn-ribbon protein
MATKTTNAELSETIENQKRTISQALNRISALNDDIVTLRGEVRRFKQDVAKDVTYLTQRIKVGRVG